MAIQRCALGSLSLADARPDVIYEANVVIVGGAAMAHALAEYGISCVLLERTDSIPEVHRGDVLQPLTLQFLDRWGSMSKSRRATLLGS